MQSNLLSTSGAWHATWNANWARPDLKRVRVAVAYCSRNGAAEIVARWNDNSVPVEFLVGLNDGVTDFDARETLWQWGRNAQVEARSTFQPSGRFHPKIYVFECANEVRVLLGSVNLTHSAFHQNSEATLELIVSRDEAVWLDLDQQLNQWWQGAQPLSRPSTEERLFKLMREGVLVEFEVQTAALLAYFKKDVFEVGDNRHAQKGAVTLQRINSSNLRLVSNARYEAILKTGKLHDALNRIAIKTNAGWFVPRSAYSSWKVAFEVAKTELAAQLAPFESDEGRTKERKIWLKELPRQIRETWMNFHRVQEPPSNPKVQEITALATQQFDLKAPEFAATVRLNVIHTPHSFPTMMGYAGKAQEVDLPAALVTMLRSEFVGAPPTMEADLYRLTLESRDAELRAWMLTLIEATRKEIIKGIEGVLNPNSKVPYKKRLGERLHQLRSLEDVWALEAWETLQSPTGTAEDYKRLQTQAVEQLRQAQSWKAPNVPLQEAQAQFARFFGWER